MIVMLLVEIGLLLLLCPSEQPVINQEDLNYNYKHETR